MLLQEVLGFDEQPSDSTRMNEEMAQAIANLLNEWNPLGERATLIKNLDGYAVEAEDILWSMDLDNKTVRQALSAVLAEAFSIDVKASKLDRYSAQIEAVIKQHNAD
jgi:hypothetical protein